MTNPQPEPQKKRQLLSAEELGPMDLLRARKLLGIDGYRLIDDKVPDVSREERTVFLLWCFESRTDPSFTYEQAERMTFRQIVDRYLLEGEDDQDDQGQDDQDQDDQDQDGVEGDERPPPPPPTMSLVEPSGNGSVPTSNGNAPSKRAARPSRKKRSGSGGVPSAAATTT